ncbi:MAG: argininosuccinate lyase [Anaerolineae bacterium]|nr:argininosuccinate lyase [Anaerolineae bacterium]MDW8067792.1 argininosuccinate lyase [Anaerolineae bacterium]
MKLWGGRFARETDRQMEAFNASIQFDQRMWAADIRGSIAYARALERAGLISAGERDTLIQGLEEVARELAAGEFVFLPSDEDIHTAVERRLRERVGSVADKLHTGRSRNDQVVTDLRLYLLEEIPVLRRRLQDLQRAIVDRAEEHLEVIMPGYTHLQHAQPVRFSHWLMSFFWAFARDQERLQEIERRIAVLPLGSGALAGHSLGIDRRYLADELGFRAIAENSIDAISDRDFVAEFLFWAALLEVHLSRLAEDLILWSSAEFGFVELDETYATGSSLMPQKRNPDSLELLRGKAGRLIGSLTGLLTTLKGLPTGYNKDLQEDKEPLFDAIDTLHLALPVAAGVIRTLHIHPERMVRALDDGMLATDLADYLVRRGVPFRQSHHLVGRAVRRAEELGIPLRALPLSEFQAISSAFGPDLYDVFDHRRSVEARSSEGGTALAALQEQIARARRILGE